ncbi:DUF2231 domain-containing protein [Parablastomonas sp. CN1-191]|uniref:DUF2231 domain-containing protein n=1 Tax=Parablastomonas sp. CN1-191 TaxID=3400908 RepID=UPI003BF84801
MNAIVGNQLTKAIWVGFALLIAGLMIAPSPAAAHKDHKRQEAAAQPASASTSSGPAASASAMESPAEAGHTAMAPMMDDMDMDRSKMSFLERLIAWFGRMHPAIVHFPIAFFPAALFTAVVGRRRPSFAAPVQFLVVTGGIVAPIAALAGWVAGMSADPEPILTYHRWLGVGVGILGAGMGYWAWRRPWEDRGAGMILALTVITVAVILQGFLGASITHGMEHMMF